MHFRATFSQRRQLSKQSLFLAHFKESGNIVASAKQTGISRHLVYYWRDNSSTFEGKLSAAADVAFQVSQSTPPIEGRKSKLLSASQTLEGSGR